MKSWNPETKAPLHVETGFFKINPRTDEVAFMLAHNFGWLFSALVHVWHLFCASSSSVSTVHLPFVLSQCMYS